MVGGLGTAATQDGALIDGQSGVASKLGLGGHSFIQELGNDPQPSPDEQRALVSACLDAGVALFDTTYYQERVALGGLLQALGRRDEADEAREPKPRRVVQRP